MKDVKLAIIYYSSTGTNYQLSKAAEAAAQDLDVNEIKFLRVEESVPEDIIKTNEDWLQHYNATKDIPVASAEDLDWADAIIFSAPTRYGNLPSQFNSLMDTTGPMWQEGKLVDKVVSAMTSAANPHAGQEGTLHSIYKAMMHWGAIVANPAFTDPIIFETGGNPYGFSVVAGKELDEKDKKAIRAQVKRTLSIAAKLKA